MVEMAIAKRVETGKAISLGEEACEGVGHLREGL